MEPVSPVIVDSEDLHETVYAEDQPQYSPLPSIKHSRGEVLTRWHLSLRERLLVLLRGDVYVNVLTFEQPLQPIQLQVERPVDLTTAVDGQCFVLAGWNGHTSRLYRLLVGWRRSETTARHV